uniref:Uncharacterized protein n=1 Tax=Anguilla anguilla TaxID=7936 RepID=A0A0E9X2M6_ANGAN
MAYSAFKASTKRYTFTKVTGWKSGIQENMEAILPGWLLLKDTALVSPGCEQTPKRKTFL